MLNKNTIPVGILIGLTLPLLAVVIFEGFFPNVLINHRRGVQYLVTLGLNFILMRYFAGKHLDKIVTGMVIVTFAFMIWVFLYRFQI